MLISFACIFISLSFGSLTSEAATSCYSTVYAGATKDFNVYTRTKSIVGVNQNDHSAGTTAYDANYANPVKLGQIATANTGCTCALQIKTLHRDSNGIIDTYLTVKPTEVTTMTAAGYVDKTTTLTDKTIYCTEKPGDCGASTPLYRILNFNYDYTYDTKANPSPFIRSEIMCYIWGTDTCPTTAAATMTLSSAFIYNNENANSALYDVVVGTAAPATTYKVLGTAIGRIADVNTNCPCAQQLLNIFKYYGWPATYAMDTILSISGSAEAQGLLFGGWGVNTAIKKMYVVPAEQCGACGATVPIYKSEDRPNYEHYYDTGRAGVGRVRNGLAFCIWPAA